jgi:hypothetical protein
MAGSPVLLSITVHAQEESRTHWNLLCAVFMQNQRHRGECGSTTPAPIIASAESIRG